MNTRPLTLDHLGEITEVHCAAFPRTALTALGKGTVQRYYTWLLNDRHDSFCLGVWRKGLLEGFIFAGHFKGATGGFVRRNRYFLVRQVVLHPWLVMNRDFRQRLGVGLRAIVRRQRSTRGSRDARENDTSDEPHFGVLSIAVHPRAWGEGIADLLMDRAECEARRRGATKVVLTVHPSNARAVRYYEKSGWTRSPSKNIWDGLMIKQLIAGEESPALHSE